jgi:hypothetical protein
MVDIYESLAILVIFSNEEFDMKSSFLFQLYDFDNSKDMVKNTYLTKKIKLFL